MKRQWKAKLTYTIDSGHPDFACIHDWEEGKVYVYEDVYTCDVDVEREKIAAYARNDMLLVAGGGYNHDHVCVVSFEIKE